MILLLPTHLISKNINESILVIVHSNAIFVTLLPHNLEVWKTINLPMNRPKKLSNAKYATIQLQDRDTWSNTKKVFLISTEKNLYNKLSKEKDKRPCLVISRLKWLRFKTHFITAWIQCPKYLINEIYLSIRVILSMVTSWSSYHVGYRISTLVSACGMLAHRQC